MSRLVRRRSWALPAALALSMMTAAASVAAQPAGSAQSEGRERYERGVDLFAQKDHGGALAEFQRAYQLTPYSVVLYNLGLTYAALGRPVEAVDALQKVLDAPGSLSSERVAQARAVRAEQAARVAELSIVSNVEGARIEIDGAEVARAPLAAPLRIKAGPHRVGLVLSGYVPSRKEVDAPAGTRTEVRFELVATDRRLGLLTVKTRLPGAQLLVDGDPVAVTPLPGPIALMPGQREIELRRPGYQAARTELSIGEARTPRSRSSQEDAAAVRAEGAQLALDITERDAVVTVDGRARGAYLGALTLPPGAHRLRVERAGFFTVERDVEVAPRRLTTLRVELEPTAETRASYTSSARTWRTLGWVGVGAGVALAAGGAAYLGYNSGAKSDSDDEVAAFNQSTPGPTASAIRGHWASTRARAISGATRCARGSPSVRPRHHRLDRDRRWRRGARRRVVVLLVGTIPVATTAIPPTSSSPRPARAPGQCSAGAGHGRALRELLTREMAMRSSTGRRRSRGCSGRWCSRSARRRRRSRSRRATATNREVAAVGEGCLINTDCTERWSAPPTLPHRVRGVARLPGGQRCIIADRPFRVCQLEDERACSYNSECSGEQVCAIDGQCRDQCAADRDCVPGQICTSGTCAAEEELVDGGLRPVNDAQATGQPCAYTSECPSGLVCRDGLCNWECITSADCNAFGTCNADRRCDYPDAGVVYCRGTSVCACPLPDGESVTGSRSRWTTDRSSGRARVPLGARARARTRTGSRERARARARKRTRARPRVRSGQGVVRESVSRRCAGGLDVRGRRPGPRPRWRGSPAPRRPRRRRRWWRAARRRRRRCEASAGRRCRRA